jgi:DNA polymerase-1
MSDDPDLVDSFNQDQDVHRRTAQDIYGLKSPDQVTDAQRSVAKAINFGLMYGKTAFGLAEELGITRTEAKEMIERYFKRYSGVKTFLDSLIIRAKETSQVETLLGRVRPLPDIHAKNPMIRANAERMAMNTPIQGTAADLMKLAMIRLHEGLKKFKSRMIIQVHDEIVLEVLESELQAVQKLVKESLEHAFDGVVAMKLPLKANLAVGNNWMDL